MKEKQLCPPGAADGAAPEASFAPGALATEAMIKLQGIESERGRDPSNMPEAFQAWMLKLEAMANRAAEDRIFLGCAPPGAGKTTLVTAFLQALMESPAYEDRSAIVFLSRKEDITKLIEDLGLPRDCIGVFTSEKVFDGFERDRARKARILITTQQMAESRFKQHGSFAKTKEFHFRGRPRDVRWWDEGMLTGETIKVSKYEIDQIKRSVAFYSPELAKHLDALTDKISDSSNREMIEIPDFEAVGGASKSLINQILSTNADSTRMNENQRIASRLWRLKGRIVTVINDRAAMTALDYEETIPRDLGPILVTDASIRVRAWYDLLERQGNRVERLPEVKRDFSNLIIHVLKEFSGKGQFKKRSVRDTYIRQAAETIRKAPRDQEWLIVHYMYSPQFPYRLADDIAEAIGEDQLQHQDGRPRVHFIHWGQERATNKYRHVQNVMLLGVLSLPQSEHEGRTRLGLAARQGERVSQQDVEALEDGEKADLILQACCRGAIRNGSEIPCNLYVILKTKSQLERRLGWIAPGALVEDWEPVEIKLPKMATKAVEYLVMRSEHEDGGHWVPLSDVMRAVGCEDPDNFRKRVRKLPGFKKKLARLGIAEHRDGKTMGYAL